MCEIEGCLLDQAGKVFEKIILISFINIFKMNWSWYRFGNYFFLIFVGVQGKIDFKNHDKLVSATTFVVNKFEFFKSTANFVSYSKCDKNFINEVLKLAQVDARVAIKIESSELMAQRSELRFCNIIIVEKIEEITKFVERFSAHTYDQNGFFLAVVTGDVDLNDFKELFKAVWKRRIINFSIMHEVDGSVQITTFMPFDGESCGGNLTSITRLFARRSSEIFPNKLKDLKRCFVSVTTFENQPVMVKDGSEIVGRDILLLRAVSQALNFSLNIDFLEELYPFGTLFSNGTGTGAIGKLLSNQTDIIIGGYLLKLERRKFMGSSIAFYEAQMIFIIPPPAKFSWLDKLFQPFEISVWIVCLLCFMTGVLVICLINKMAETVRKTVYGDKVSSPFTNMVRIILGMSQPTVPSKVFARFTLTMFIFLTLVLRCLYQGAWFRHLQSDDSHTGIRSVEEIVEQKLQFVISGSHQDLLQEDPKFRDT